MQKQSLAELLRDLEQEMLRLGYTKGSMAFYRGQWKKLLQFAEGGLEINPREYLEDIFRRIMSHNFQKLEELLPDQWALNRESLKSERVIFTRQPV